MRGTRGRPPEVSLTALHARPPDLRPAPLMEMDFAVSWPLVLRRTASIRFLFIGPRVGSALLSDPASPRSPCARLSFTSIRLDRGLSPPSRQTCSAHKKLHIVRRALPAGIKALSTARRSRPARDAWKKMHGCISDMSDSLFFRHGGLPSCAWPLKAGPVQGSGGFASGKAGGRKVHGYGHRFLS